MPFIRLNWPSLSLDNCYVNYFFWFLKCLFWWRFSPKIKMVEYWMKCIFLLKLLHLIYFKLGVLDKNNKMMDSAWLLWLTDKDFSWIVDNTMYHTVYILLHADRTRDNKREHKKKWNCKSEKMMFSIFKLRQLIMKQMLLLPSLIRLWWRKTLKG